MGSDTIRNVPHHCGNTRSLKVAIPMNKKPRSETHRPTANIGSRDSAPEGLPDTNENRESHQQERGAGEGPNEAGRSEASVIGPLPRMQTYDPCYRARQGDEV